MFVLAIIYCLKNEYVYPNHPTSGPSFESCSEPEETLSGPASNFKYFITYIVYPSQISHGSIVGPVHATILIECQEKTTW